MCAYVLVVDDDLEQVELVRGYLLGEAHSVRVVHDGRSAIDEVRYTRPDLVILDGTMSTLDGLEVSGVLRRSPPVTGRVTPPLRIGDLALDPLRQEVRVGDRLIECSPVEFRILATLVAAPGQVFSRAQLLGQAYGPDGSITERTIDAHVMNLRRKIEVTPRRPAYLRTVHGVGYQVTDGGTG